MSLSSQAAPADSLARPRAVFWARAMFWTLSALCILLWCGALVLAVVDFGNTGSTADPTESRVIAIGQIVFLSPLTVFFLCIANAPRRRWGWTTMLVGLCLAMFLPCSLPFAAPLLYYWLRADTRAWFGSARAA